MTQRRNNSTDGSEFTIDGKRGSGEIGSAPSGPIIVRSDSLEIRAFLKDLSHWTFSDIKNFERCNSNSQTLP
jgi:hypothetical protein